MAYLGRKGASAALTSADIPDNSITAAKISPDTIVAADLAPDSVDSSELVDGSIDTSHIGDDQVTADKLANSINTAIAANTAKVSFTPDAAQVFNDTGADVDFRIKSDDNANMLFVDGGEDRVGIGTATPSQPLHVAGVITSSVDSTNPPVNYVNMAYTGLQYTFDSAETSEGVTHYISGGNASTTGNFYAWRTNTGDASSAEAMRITKDGKVGIGVIPETTWHSSYSMLQIGNYTAVGNHSDGYTYLQNNAYDNAGTTKYLNTNEASGIRLDLNGDINFVNAPSGSADATVTWTTGCRMIYGGTKTVEFPSTDTATLQVYQVATGESAMRIYKNSNDATNAQKFIDFTMDLGGTITANGRITGNGSGTAAFQSWSDERLKENIVTITGQLALINQLRPVAFDWKVDGTSAVGFIAQEFKTVLPDNVSTDEPTEQQIDDGETGTMCITAWSSTEARLVGAIQELSTKNDALETRILALESA